MSFLSFALFAYGKKIGFTRESQRKKTSFFFVIPLVCTIFVPIKETYRYGIEP